MPPKRSAIGWYTPQARRKKASRAKLALETDEKREARLETVRVCVTLANLSETDEQQDPKIETVQIRTVTAKASSSVTDEQQEARLEIDSID